MNGEELHVVFNFYEKITPPPKFSNFVDGWKHLGKFVEGLEHYVCAQLHENLDPKGLFPYVNFSTFKGTEKHIIQELTNPSQQLVQALIEGHGLPGHQINHPGGYNEIATDDENPIAPDLPPRDDSVFFISCFQMEEKADNEAELKSNWKQLVDIDIITSLVKSQGKKIGRAGFYKRFTPAAPFSTFSYVFRCELLGFEGTEPVLWDMVRKWKESSASSGRDGMTMVDSSLYKIVYVSIPRNNNKE